MNEGLMLENENPKIDFSNTNDLLLIEEELVTPVTWEDNKIEMLGLGMEYINGQYHMVRILKAMLEQTKTEEELRNELNGFIEERLRMRDWAIRFEP